MSGCQFVSTNNDEQRKMDIGFTVYTGFNCLLWEMSKLLHCYKFLDIAAVRLMSTIIILILHLKLTKKTQGQIIELMGVNLHKLMVQSMSEPKRHCILIINDYPLHILRDTHVHVTLIVMFKDQGAFFKVRDLNKKLLITKNDFISFWSLSKESIINKADIILS